MSWAGLVYLGMTIGIFVIFALIVVWTYSSKRKKRLEEPKQRMLDED